MATTEDLDFSGSEGNRLAGVLTRPGDGDLAVHGSVLLAHCFTCSKDLHTLTRLSRALAAAGYASLRFDFTGLGESEGSFATSSVSRNVTDLVHAGRALIEHGFGPCAAVGHSLGGAALLLAANRLKTVRSLAVVGAPATAAHVAHLFEGEEERIRAEGVASVSIGGRPFDLSAGFLDDLEGCTSTVHIGTLGRPLLVVHSPEDETVPVAEGEAIFAAASQPKSFVPLIGADHLVSDRGRADRLAAVLIDWFDATL